MRFLVVLSLLVTSLTSFAEGKSIRADECRLSSESSLGEGEFLIKGSESKGSAAAQETYDNFKKEFHDQFGRLIGQEFSITTFAEQSLKYPEDVECSERVSASILRQCSVGQDYKTGYCRSVCRIERWSPDCR